MKFRLETEYGLDFDQRTGLSTYGHVGVQNGKRQNVFSLIPHENIYDRTMRVDPAEIEKRIRQACHDFSITIIQLLLVQ